MINESQILLSQYIKLTEFLAKVLGPHYEISLYDLTLPNKPLIAIANKHITKRIIGDPPSSDEEIIINNNSSTEQDFSINYCTYAPNGRQVRTSSFFIKNGRNELIGLFCLHFDDARFLDISRSILGLCHPDSFVNTNVQLDDHYKDFRTNSSSTNANAAYNTNPKQDIRQFIKDYALDKDMELSRLSQKEKLDIINALNNAGFFLVKGAIAQAADELYCSQSSVYRYISMLNKANK